MSPAVDARETGRRVEDVLDRIAAGGDREACAAAEELVRVLMDFYGAGLARLVGGLGEEPLRPLLDDELVASLLALHDLHPEDVHTRISRALAAAGDPAQVLGFDESTGVLRLRPEPAGSGCGCGGSAGGPAGQRALEDALGSFAPEVTRVEREEAAPQPALLQISTRPHAPARAR
ncbi:hypothetical protein [Streptomyces sp. NPDC048349]|uniref:hypothetical protein n=1 Tax=Streptomyces sp. NPDC048349 TaxID=3155486 RepID=UPI00343D0524